MMKRTIYISVLLLMFGLVLSVQAGDAGRESHFSLGVGARSLGMGGAFSSLATDATAIYYNPAGLSALQYQEVAFMHTVLFEGSMYDFASWVYPITENHGLGVGYMRIGTDDIIRRVDFADQGLFDYYHSQFLLSYGRNMGELLSAGVSLKIVNQSLEANSDFGVGLDVGMTGVICKNLSVSLVARDILRAELKLEAIREKTPMSVAGGLSVSDVAISEHVALTTSADLEKSEDRSFKLHAGTELEFHDAFSIRLGYDRDNTAFGAGLKHGRLKVDYAYKVVDYVTDIHHFSLSFLLGPSMPERIRQRELAQLPPELTPEEKEFRDLLEKANRYLRRFQLDSAASCFQQALEHEPDNREIIGSLAAIEEARRTQREQEVRLREAEDELNQTLNSFLGQAELLYANKTYRASLDLLSLIFDTDPDNPRARQLRNEIEDAMSTEVAESFELARISIKEDRLVEAIEAYNRILEIDPANEGARKSKQQVLATMGLPQKIRLGIELYEKGRHEEARAQFEDILEVNPEEATTLEYLKRIEEAQTHVATLEDLQKDQEVWDLYLEGLRHMRNKDYEKAIEVWEKVLEVCPNNPNTLNNIEQAKLRLGTHEPEN